MRLKPLGDIIVVERLAPETMSKGGIIIPAASQEHADIGTIVACGKGNILDDGVTRQAMETKVGDQVYFSSFARERIKLDGKEYVSMHEKDIFGVLDPI